MFYQLKTGAITILFMLLSTFFIHAQQATTWKVDKAHTSINFEINHFFSTVTGKFNSFEGDISFAPDNLKESSIRFTIDVNSVNTDDKKRDKHLQSGDFFDAKKYPTMKFVSSRFEKKSEKEFIMYGKLTIRDITKDVAIPFMITGEMEHPMMKGTHIMGIASKLKLDRTNYGVGTGSWAATAIVGDQVDISIHMELNRK